MEVRRGAVEITGLFRGHSDHFPTRDPGRLKRRYGSRLSGDLSFDATDSAARGKPLLDRTQGAGRPSGTSESRVDPYETSRIHMTILIAFGNPMDCEIAWTKRLLRASEVCPALPARLQSDRYLTAHRDPTRRRVRRPSGCQAGVAIASGMAGQVPRKCAVGVDNVDLLIAVAAAGKRDPVTVRRPGGPHVAAEAASEAPEVIAIGIHHVEFQVAVSAGGEGDRPPAGRVGRPTADAPQGSEHREPLTLPVDGCDLLTADVGDAEDHAGAIGAKQG